MHDAFCVWNILHVWGESARHEQAIFIPAASGPKVLAKKKQPAGLRHPWTMELHMNYKATGEPLTTLRDCDGTVGDLQRRPVIPCEKQSVVMGCFPLSMVDSRLDIGHEYHKGVPDDVDN